MFIDTHVHLVHRDRIRYSWLDSAPALNKDATHAEYRALANSLGITHALHMEVDVHEDDIEKETAMIAEFMLQPDSPLIGCIAACRPESKQFPAYLERQTDQTHIKGFRRVLHVVPDDVSKSQTFQDNINRLSNTDYVFDLCVTPNQIALVTELVDCCPDVQFLLDHCGVPDIKTAQSTGLHSPLPEPWASNMSEIARRPNVAAKISGVIAYCNGSNWTLDDLRPYVEHTISCFGWDRVVWGSDSPVCTLGGTLSQWVSATESLLAETSSTEQEKLRFQNAIRLWNLPLTKPL